MGSTYRARRSYPGRPMGRTEWDGLVLKTRAAQALRTLNPGVPPRYLDEALGEILAAASADLIAENFRFHGYLTHGYRGISYIDADGTEQNPTIRLFSHRPEDNSYLAINQVTIRTREIERRFDYRSLRQRVPAGDHGDQTGRRREHRRTRGLRATADVPAGIPRRFLLLRPHRRQRRSERRNMGPHSPSSRTTYDGISTTTARWFGTRPRPHGYGSEPRQRSAHRRGVQSGAILGQIIRNFVAFDEGADGLAKRVAKPHQYFAVTKAVGTTVEAVRSDGRAGVVWHTQGSGKSMEMELYAHLVAIRPELKNPTIVVVTDRTELDSQLFETFDRSQLLRRRKSGQDLLPAGTPGGADP